MSFRDTLDPLALVGLEPAPAQAWGRVRLVPLIRRAPRDDLRIAPRAYGTLGVVDLGGKPGKKGEAYFGYIPYGLVVGWTEDGAAVAGDTMIENPEGKRIGRWVSSHTRLVRREKRSEGGDGQSRLRLLPLHLAMEGFLALCFGGPDVAWPAYSERVLRQGLSPRSEQVLPGASVPDLGEALRLFEIHEGQCGVLVFVGGSLASAMVVSHPDDYRALHRSLVEDFYGTLLYWHGRYAPPAEAPQVRLDGARVDDWAGLAAELRRARAAWGDFELRQAAGLLGEPVEATVSYRMGPFTLSRFATGFGGDEEHLGEAIVRADGTLEYLKSFRLDRGQCRRGLLLSLLRDHGWQLDRAAAARGQDRAQLVADLERAELGYLLRG
ncbi:MAG: hypothetical protein R3F65_06425 [bacterium]